MSDNKHINVVVLQYKPIDKPLANIKLIQELLDKNKVKKGTLVVCPELSLQDYICINKDKNSFNKAISIRSKIINELKKMVREYRIYLCITIFEKYQNRFFNTAIIINSHGCIIKKYNKKHIPSEICYEEKYYFDEPKNDFQYFIMNNIKVGLLICWDQWHAKSYIKLKQKNVNLIICPTAIGTCTHNGEKIEIKGEKSKWLEVIKSNSLMNNIPVVVANRIGKESSNVSNINFWGTSFITDANGTILGKCSLKPGVIRYRYTIDEQISAKKMWNFIDINKLDR